MTCQRCREKARVHVTETVAGERVELHLCEACARAAGVAAPADSPGLPLEAVVQQLIVAHVGELVGELAEATCPDCGLAYREFRRDGRLGCPTDYSAFHAGLVPLLRRGQAASRHVGKSPRRRPGGPSPRLRIRALLRQAVAREDYEQAARLRDRLRQEVGDA